MQNKNILRNRYIGKDNIPRVKNSFIALLDILGYEHLVNLQSSKARNNSLFFKIRKLVNRCIAITDGKCDFDSKGDFRLMEYKVFSDNILIGMPIVDYITYGYQLLTLITVTGLMQVLFADSGLFVRAASTEGEISIDDRMAYGKGLIMAYKLEKNIAIYPRIVIDPKIKERNSTLFKCYKRGDERSFLLDGDGILFVNYMKTLLSMFSDKQLTAKRFYNSLKAQKESIEFMLSCFKDNAHVRSKYVWTANYYNYFCSQNMECGTYKINMDTYAAKITDKYD